MQPDDFLQENYRYFQEWEHWYDKAVSLRRTALVVYRQLLPALRRYEKATRVAHKKLEKRRVAPVLCNMPDVYPIFSLYGSALENALKSIMVNYDKDLIAAHRLSNKLKDHKLVNLAASAGVALTKQEVTVLDWVSEVVIWKGRYSVPIDITKAKFFHSLDMVSLANAKGCLAVLDVVFLRAMKKLPPRKRVVRWGVVLRLDS